MPSPERQLPGALRLPILPRRESHCRAGQRSKRADSGIAGLKAGPLSDLISGTSSVRRESIPLSLAYSPQVSNCSPVSAAGLTGDLERRHCDRLPSVTFSTRHSIRWNQLVAPTCIAALLSVLALGCGTQPPATSPENTAERGPRTQPGTAMGLYAPGQHDLYDGKFIISGGRIYQVGTLNDESPWDHMGNDGSNLRPVGGTAEINVDEIANTGVFRAELELPEGSYVIDLKEIKEFSPCQDGGIAAYLFEHGDSGCGDANWPKSLLYVAGWGLGSATLNGEPLYEDYEIHFMVTQGMRSRDLVANYPLDGKLSEAGAVNPALQQLDFYIRSPEQNDVNHPNREVFDHFFAMEVTWK